MGNPNEQKNIPEMVAELLHLVRTFLKEQLRIIVEESAAGPVRRAAGKLFSALLSAFILGLAAIFIAVSLFLLMLEFMPAWVAVGTIGIVLVVAGIIVNKAGGRG